MGVPCLHPLHNPLIFSPQCMRLVFAREPPSARTDARGSAGSHVGFLRRVSSGRRGNNRQLLGGESRPSSPPTGPPPPSPHPSMSPGLGGGQCCPPLPQQSLPAGIPAVVALLDVSTLAVPKGHRMMGGGGATKEAGFEQTQSKSSIPAPPKCSVLPQSPLRASWG